MKRPRYQIGGHTCRDYCRQLFVGLCSGLKRVCISFSLAQPELGLPIYLESLPSVLSH